MNFERTYIHKSTERTGEETIASSCLKAGKSRNAWYWLGKPEEATCWASSRESRRPSCSTLQNPRQAQSWHHRVSLWCGGRVDGEAVWEPVRSLSPFPHSSPLGNCPPPAQDERLILCRGWEQASGLGDSRHGWWCTSGGWVSIYALLLLLGS